MALAFALFLWTEVRTEVGFLSLTLAGVVALAALSGIFLVQTARRRPSYYTQRIREIESKRLVKK